MLLCRTESARALLAVHGMEHCLMPLFAICTVFGNLLIGILYDIENFLYISQAHPMKTTRAIIIDYPLNTPVVNGTEN